ncbi:MAG: hypothetical protein D8M57_05745 [Candidatus Scalindua sp. AMX11]|nr:MAG: hypothetical protein DWQ00_02110 [Candidatus Scalindua sp.]NOG82841.1 hypothetical protein [Planctomycetota bacterium]RZV86188.1 MAG: hypothetical protein EX341_07415 [Candidatus Scalindua sp. SCAELEC01]TDE65808.1 MAG: hypothetical protein D8M57_05745 [Candidatus Scalindua sp. AMX11]GJQ58313.1 MAG: hypothetical protein SCALA701_11140 [Candidatus Scalindua sp.]
MRNFILTTTLKSFFVLASLFLVSNFFLRIVSCEEEVSEVPVAEVADANKKITLLEEHKSYLATSKNTFLYYCAPCHGDKGNGKGIYFTIDLEPKPTDLTHVEYMAKLTDDYLINWIKSGSSSMGKSDLCPPWGGTFDEERIKGVIGYLRSLTIEKQGDIASTEGDTLVAQSSVSNGAPEFIKWGVLILLCLIFMFAARNEWKKLKAEKGSES